MKNTIMTNLLPSPPPATPVYETEGEKNKGPVLSTVLKHFFLYFGLLFFLCGSGGRDSLSHQKWIALVFSTYTVYEQ